MNTGEIQVAPGSRSLASQPHSKKRSEWHYNLREVKRSQRQGGHGRNGSRGGDKAPTVEEGSLEAQAGSPSGGIRRSPPVQSRPLRISDISQRSRPAYWAISVGRWRSLRACKILDDGPRRNLSVERVLQSSVFARGTVDLQPRASAEWAPP